MKNLILTVTILLFSSTTGYTEERFAQRAEEEYVSPAEEEVAVPENDELFEPSFELEIDYWGATLDSSGKFVEEGQGTDFDMKDDLGFEDTGVPGLKLKIYTGPKSDIRFNVVSFSYDGDKRLEKKITFEGETYFAGTRVISTLDVVYYGVGWAWHFFSNDDNTVQFGTLVELKGISMEASLETPDLLQKGSASINTMFPTFGLSFTAKATDKLLFLAEFAGISAGQYGHFVDADIGLRFFPIKNVIVSGGYRVFDVEAKDDPDYFKFNMSGPYLGLGGRF